jgi:hypothetical protein
MPTDTAPLFVLWFRPSTGGRWRRLGRYSTRAECVQAIGDARGGDYWIQEQIADDAPGGLFAAVEPAEPTAAEPP